MDAATAPAVLISPETLIGLEGPHTELLREAGFSVRYPVDPAFTRGRGEEETIAALRGVQAVLAGGEILTAGVLAALPELRVIARFGVGYDRIDIDAATARGIPVTITPTSNHEAVAEQALALLFAVAKSVPVNDRRTRAGEWRGEPTAAVRGKVLGIVGLGRIGRSLAVRARALGMTVIAADPAAGEEAPRELGIELVDLDALLSRADVVSLHCPLDASTEGLLDARRLARMKRGSVLINTARGGLVVEADLVAALSSGHLRGAGLDVFEEEPPSPGSPLLKLDGVVVSPHIGGTDERSRLDMALEAARCIVDLASGRWPEGAVVNDSLRGAWRW